MRASSFKALRCASSTASSRSCVSAPSRKLSASPRNCRLHSKNEVEVPSRRVTRRLRLVRPGHCARKRGQTAGLFVNPAAGGLSRCRRSNLLTKAAFARHRNSFHPVRMTTCACNVLKKAGTRVFCSALSFRWMRTGSHRGDTACD